MIRELVGAILKLVGAILIWFCIFCLYKMCEENRTAILKLKKEVSTLQFDNELGIYK